MAPSETEHSRCAMPEGWSRESSDLGRAMDDKVRDSFIPDLGK